MNKFKNVDDYADQMENTASSFIKYVFFTILGISIAFLLGFVIKWLWNSLVTDIFDLRAITYWEGVGLLILAKIIFGFGGSGSSSSSHKKKAESGRGLVGQEIHDAMQEEFRKEYYEKYPEATENVSEAEELSAEDARTTNLEQEDMYDKWWQTEGEKQFEAFLRNQQ